MPSVWDVDAGDWVAVDAALEGPMPGTPPGISGGGPPGPPGAPPEPLDVDPVFADFDVVLLFCSSEVKSSFVICSAL